MQKYKDSVIASLTPPVQGGVHVDTNCIYVQRYEWAAFIHSPREVNGVTMWVVQRYNTYADVKKCVPPPGYDFLFTTEEIGPLFWPVINGDVVVGRWDRETQEWWNFFNVPQTNS